MADPVPCVRGGVLVYEDAGRRRAVAVGGAAWRRWLEQSAAAVFRFEDPEGHFTARRERRRGGWYWYAYRRRDGTLRKAYLGRQEALSAEGLRAVAGALARPRVAARITMGAAARRVSLPAELTSFVGRAREVPRVVEQLRGARLLTLTGPGGSGKTRIALAAARAVQAIYPDGVWFIDLAPLADGDLLGQTAMATVGVRERPGRPAVETLVYERSWSRSTARNSPSASCRTRLDPVADVGGLSASAHGPSRRVSRAAVAAPARLCPEFWRWTDGWRQDEARARHGTRTAPCSVSTLTKGGPSHEGASRSHAPRDSSRRG